MRKPKTIFAEHSGTLYVRVEAVMHPLVPFHDGLPLTRFGNEEVAYITVDEAIAWCEKEQQLTQHKPQDEKIAALRKAKAEFAAMELPAPPAEAGGEGA